MTARLRFRASLAVVALLAGCGPAATRKLARQAERRGDIHEAYDFYCEWAAEFPDHVEAGEAISRLGPTAANYWFSRARSAWREGRTVDTWRTAMRALEIRPDHADAAALVRRIETNYAGEVALARRTWQTSGTSALTETEQPTALTDVPSPSLASELDSTGVALAASKVDPGADLQAAARPDAALPSRKAGSGPFADIDESETAAPLLPRFTPVFIAGACGVALLCGLGIYRSFLNRTPRQKTGSAARR